MLDRAHYPRRGGSVSSTTSRLVTHVLRRQKRQYEVSARRTKKSRVPGGSVVKLHEPRHSVKEAGDAFEESWERNRRLYEAVADL